MTKVPKIVLLLADPPLVSVSIAAPGNFVLNQMNILNCTVTTQSWSTAPNIQWKDPSNAIITNTASTIVGSVTVVNGTIYTSMLTFVSADPTQDGHYTCEATVESQSVTASSNIAVQGT